MIQHTIAFKLKHAPGSQEEKDFLADAALFAAIPGVKNFICLRQISKQNPYDFGLSMQFDNQESYDLYTRHPEHQALVAKRWLTEVTDFLELDYSPLSA